MYENLMFALAGIHVYTTIRYRYGCMSKMEQALVGALLGTRTHTTSTLTDVQSSNKERPQLSLMSCVRRTHNNIRATVPFVPHLATTDRSFVYLVAEREYLCE